MTAYVPPTTPAKTVDELGPRWFRAGEFVTFVQWEKNAASWIGGTGAACFDVKGRRCIGVADMMRARDEGAFPVGFYFGCP